MRRCIVNLLIDPPAECAPSGGFFGVVSSGVGAEGYEPLKRKHITGRLVWLKS
jgi:hypothetical protein